MSELFVQTQKQSIINIKDITQFKDFVYNKLQNHFIIIGHGKEGDTIILLDDNFTYLTSILPMDKYNHIYINYHLNELMITSESFVYFLQLNNYTLRKKVNLNPKIHIYGYIDDEIFGAIITFPMNYIMKLDHDMNIIKHFNSDIINYNNNILCSEWNPSMRELIVVTENLIIIYDGELRYKRHFNKNIKYNVPHINIDVNTGYIYLIYQTSSGILNNLNVLRSTDGSIVSTHVYPLVYIHSIQVVPEQNKIYLLSGLKIIYILDMITDRIGNDGYLENDDEGYENE